VASESLFIRPIAGVGRFGAFAFAVLRAIVTGRFSLAQVMSQASLIATRCIVPVSATIAPFGAVIGVQGMVILKLFSAERLLSSLLALFVVRELGPVLAGVLVAAQAGSSVAAELGAMRIKEELDATAVMAVDPIGWHVAPRVLAFLLVVPALTTIANVFGIAGGAVVAVGLKDQPAGVFLAYLAANIGVWDLVASAFKGAIYGGMIGLLACWKGFHATGGAEGVGRAVNDTVVQSVMYILVLNYLLSSMLFGNPG